MKRPVAALLLFVSILIGGTSPRAFGEPPPAPAPPAGPTPAQLATAARERAKSFAESKNWEAARDEASKAAQLDAGQADAWLILAACEQRLDHYPEARDAYRQYLALNPPAESAEAVRARLAQVEPIADKRETADREARAIKYGRNAKGLILGLAPIYRPKVAGPDELGHRASSAFLLGYRFGETVSAYLRWQTGTIATFKTTTSGTTPLTNLSAKLVAIEGERAFILNDPFEGFYGFQLYVPLNLQIFSNWVSGPTNVYMNFGFALGTGAGVRFYTGGPAIFDAAFLYHVAAPLNVVESANGDKALNASGATVKGDASGPEFRLTASIPF